MPSIHPLMTLFVLAIPIACIAWTVTHEEVFREPRDWCQAKCQNCPSIYQRKFFYLFTCEYCLSHYVTLGFLFITRYRLLYDDWRGYVIAGFSLVWVAKGSDYSHLNACPATSPSSFRWPYLARRR